MRPVSSGVDITPQNSIRLLRINTVSNHVSIGSLTLPHGILSATQSCVYLRVSRLGKLVITSYPLVYTSYSLTSIKVLLVPITGRASHHTCYSNCLIVSLSHCIMKFTTTTTSSLLLASMALSSPSLSVAAPTGIEAPTSPNPAGTPNIRQFDSPLFDVSVGPGLTPSNKRAPAFRTGPGSPRRNIRE